VFRKKQIASPLNRQQAMACVPVKNTDVAEERLDTGEVLLSYPMATRPWIDRLARAVGAGEPKIRRKKLQLDALGTAVWDLMDGRRTVRQVVRAFSKTHQLEDRESEMSVTLFLRQLGKRGIVGLR
jgi:hypothetical protein